ncbi:MAG: Fis family transcriptional regulator [Gammaproteobacteria bacterium]|nr:Fis family transcriptional regulator [Gammaproteobacteria bacterium]
MNQSDLHDCIHHKLERYFTQLDEESPSGVFKMVTQQTETATLKFVLDKVNQNHSEAARILGINRATLKKKVALYQL